MCPPLSRDTGKEALYFPYCCDGTHNRKLCKRGRIYFSLESEGRVRYSLEDSVVAISSSLGHSPLQGGENAGISQGSGTSESYETHKSDDTGQRRFSSCLSLLELFSAHFRDAAFPRHHPRLDDAPKTWIPASMIL